MNFVCLRFLKIVKKLAYANQVLFKDFQFSEVHFKNDKFLSLFRDELKNPEDKKTFGSSQVEDVSKFALEEVLRDTYIGVLKYFFKEDLSEKSIIRNKKRYNR